MRPKLRRLGVVATAVALAGAAGVGTAAANGIADINMWSTNTRGVLCVQYALNWYDHEWTNNPNWQNWVTVDGEFGPQTRQAVIWYQEHINAVYGANTLAVDGIVGQYTGGYLASEDARAAEAGYGPLWIFDCPTHLPDINR